MNLLENMKLQDGYEQVCIFHGMIIRNKKDIAAMVNFIKDQFNVRIQYLESIETKPDIKFGKPVLGTGGRHDVFFAIHKEDLGKFIIPKLHLDARWIEDVLAEGNYRSPIYPKRVFDYCCWNENHLAKIRE